MNILHPAPAPVPVVTRETDARAIADPAIWHRLYRIGAWAALIVVGFIPIQAVIFLASPPPDTVAGWFKLFRRSPLLGLLDMDLLYIVDNVFAALVILALLVALWRVSPALMSVGGTLGFLGIAAFFASNPAFSMLSLSHSYWDATTDAQRSIYLAAGEAMMSTWQGSAYLASYLLGGIATLLIAFVMLRSAVFSRRTAAMGLAAGVLMLWPPVNTVLVVISLLSLIPLLIWYVLIARRLLQITGSGPALIRYA